MEHEVFVPFPAETVRQALADPARVARSVPGLQRHADGAADALTGRMRVRVGSSTITYRGTLRVTEQDGGELAVEGEGTEARGDGSAVLAMVVRLGTADGGTVLTCSGTVRSKGRLAEVPADAAAATGRRLLDRFAAGLAADLEAAPLGPTAIAAQSLSGEGPEASGEAQEGTGRTEPGARPGADEPGPEAAALGRPDDNEPVIPGIPAPESGTPGEPPDAARKETPEQQSATPGEPSDDGSDAEAGAGSGGDGVPERASVFETEVPPPSLDPLADDVAELMDEPPAEAAHARRTMIGRSAEEVDHAPPRGRYAPIPAPHPASAGDTLRWAAPAAAAVLATAVIITRALRRKR